MHDRTSSSLRLASLAVDTVTNPAGGFFGGAATHASMSAAQTTSSNVGARQHAGMSTSLIYCQLGLPARQPACCSMPHQVTGKCSGVLADTAT